MKRLGLVMVGAALLQAGGAAAAERVWDQAKAKKKVEEVLAVEKTKKRPWNRIPWRKSVLGAASEAERTGKALFVFFYVECEGPPLEPCGPEGRLLRASSLSSSTVLSLVKSHFIPVKIPIQKGKGFPVNWPALTHWATAYRFSNGKGFTGCSVVSPDLGAEYGNTGSARIWEMFESTAYDPKKFASMLELAVSRATEERALMAQRGISTVERQMEVHRFRSGMNRAVQSEGRSRLPAKGFSLAKAIELFEIAGAHEDK